MSRAHCSSSTRFRPAWGGPAASGPIEQLPVQPDVMTAAKALGGGLPVGAVVTTPELAETFEPGDHGTTFGGGPVAASAALAALEVIGDDELLANVRDAAIS